MKQIFKKERPEVSTWQPRWMTSLFNFVSEFFYSDMGLKPIVRNFLKVQGLAWVKAMNDDSLLTNQFISHSQGLNLSPLDFSYKDRERIKQIVLKCKAEFIRDLTPAPED